MGKQGCHGLVGYHSMSHNIVFWKNAEGVNALAVRGYPGVAAFHASLMAVTYAKEKPFWIKVVIFFHNSLETPMSAI
jgi:hypothetical protein